MSYYRVGHYHVLPGKEKEFETLARQLLIDTRGVATDRVKVYLIRLTDDPQHYCIAGQWKTATQYQGIQQTPVRRGFDEKVESLLSRPRYGELFEVLAEEP